MATRRTVRIEITATDTTFYIKYIGEDPKFHKACTTLHYDEIDKTYSEFYGRKSHDTISVHFPGSRPEVKHSEGSYQVSLLPKYMDILQRIFTFPNAVLNIESNETSDSYFLDRFKHQHHTSLCFPDSFTYQEWRKAIAQAPQAGQSVRLILKKPRLGKRSAYKSEGHTHKVVVSLLCTVVLIVPVYAHIHFAVTIFLIPTCWFQFKVLIPCPPASNLLHASRLPSASSIMPPSSVSPASNTEPPPRFSIKSAFARLTTALHT